MTEYSINENLNAPEPSQDHLHDTSEGRRVTRLASEANAADVHTSDVAPQQHTATTIDPVSASTDEPATEEELSLPSSAD